MVDGSDLVAFAFVVVVNDVYYIDPVVVASARKRLGLGSALVRQCLGSLADAGVFEVGATITDGNVASERLFVGLGFDRLGSWDLKSAGGHTTAEHLGARSTPSPCPLVAMARLHYRALHLGRTRSPSRSANAALRAVICGAAKSGLRCPTPP
ncbi:MAG: GNAT family N-acetyltransferase [Rhodococcus sp. (in: high G+C Gram-positive bacteria)]